MCRPASAAHSLETPIACEKNKLNADFYVKTFHMDRYWSATPVERREEYCWYKPQTADHDGYHDNMWCLDAEKTAAFMETVAKPWIAFKVMAAGAIPPQMAFSHAYRQGADFIVAGMFDFQIEDGCEDRHRGAPEDRQPPAPLARISMRCRFVATVCARGTEIAG